MLNIYSDGGARGNPGPAAAAYIILSEKDIVLKTEARYLGRRTNNQAEYEAVIAALEAASQLGENKAICHLDSELVSKHLSGEYKVRNVELRKLWAKAQELIYRFKVVKFKNVPRSNKFIKKADALVNETLDKVMWNHDN